MLADLLVLIVVMAVFGGLSWTIGRTPPANVGIWK